ncbi:MAG: glycoside hydrolase family 127 protein [Candidatus Heimdallarchaeum endolithica]|uniref:Glycoside hydrolase family 127 protein n=1 Tax=Candidatus Heimdallarchaeum endolithica TaxID=2876572 RepID=A0A9Y1FNY7_9ARCH|nr:MAG: glycoside hydrolase family 127 protein [Candidatus Heimdallarchaeum endolithica]
MNEKNTYSSLFFTSISYTKVNINHGFWKKIQNLNEEKAIFHQWRMLEQSGCIDNFRIVAKKKEGYRKGLFYCDSDVHKWSEAAIRIFANKKNKKLKELIEQYISILKEAQDEDGYIYTYNQFFFPGTKWKNLLIEHELYTAGHLIEAAIEHYQTTKERNYLKIAEKVADAICVKFSNSKSIEVPGHQEIEIALIKLFRVKKEIRYLDLAKKFIEDRGRKKLFFIQMIREHFSVEKRTKEANKQIEKFTHRKEEEKVMSDLKIDKIPFLKFRFYYSALNGKYMQHNKPLLKMKHPEGHSVRFTYFMTAAALLQQELKERLYLQQLERIWKEMVTKYMYVTGGLGSLPMIEGFAKAYELPNKYAYCETCAAIGSVFWSSEMLRLTGKAFYSDLVEWQLYNAILVSASIDGKKYFYYNPMVSNGNYERKSWYKTACCPSNYSRVIAKIGEYIYSIKDQELWIHQYISNYSKIGEKIEFSLISQFPWEGKTKLILNLGNSNNKFSRIHFRFPSWTNRMKISVNGHQKEYTHKNNIKTEITASGYNPFLSEYITISDIFSNNAEINLEFQMDINKFHSHKKIKENRGKISLGHGPLVYCFEKIDNPNSKIPFEVLDPSYLEVKNFHFPNYGEIKVIETISQSGEKLVAIPYFLWGNRGKTNMQVWIKEKK